MFSMPVIFQKGDLYPCNTLNMENQVHCQIKTRELFCCHDVSLQRIRQLSCCPLLFSFLFRECATADGTYSVPVQPSSMKACTQPDQSVSGHQTLPVCFNRLFLTQNSLFLHFLCFFRLFTVCLTGVHIGNEVIHYLSLFSAVVHCKGLLFFQFSSAVTRPLFSILVLTPANVTDNYDQGCEIKIL